MHADDHLYRLAQSRDSRFDGCFFLGVTSTGIYCRPSCPAMTPKRANVRFYPTAAAAQQHGFRACRRCRPDATPGSPEWNLRADVVGRAMRLIADGWVDRHGVAGLARRLGYSERHLNRQLVAEVGAGPLALARAQRAQTARTLIETTNLRFADVAFAAGFASVRQFNDTVRAIFATTPSGLRKVPRAERTGAGALVLRLPFRSPMAGPELLAFLGTRAVPGVESFDGVSYSRTLRLSHGAGVVTLTPGAEHVTCRLRLADLRDLTRAVERCRRLLDLDADPVAVDGALSGDAVLGPLVRAVPGRRVPGCVDGSEMAVRAVLGQQVSVAGARTIAGRLVAQCGSTLPQALRPDGETNGETDDESGGALDGAPHRLFPTPGEITNWLTGEPGAVGVPGSRRRALLALTSALAADQIELDPGADRCRTTARLLALPGIGPWTVAYVAMRALADTDAFLPTDLGARRAVEGLGHPSDAASLTAQAEVWRPWRAYALQHLWAALASVPARSQPLTRSA